MKGELGVLCGAIDMHEREAEEEKKNYSFGIIYFNSRVALERGGYGKPIFHLVAHSAWWC